MATDPPPLGFVEVGPRDGLQNEAEIVPTATKLELIGRLVDAGARRIEVASFVHVARVPQMGDAEDVIAGLPGRADISWIGLCLNKRGVLRAIESRAGGRRGVDEAGCVLVCTDSFGQRNQGQTVAEGVAANTGMLRLAATEGLLPQVTLSAAFGCPFEGEVPAGRVVALAQRMAEAGAVEIALADTIGAAVPAQVEELFGQVAEAVPGVRLRAHFHNTRGTGLANAWAAAGAGASVIDASLGGLGGCPFAPRATGNIASEDAAWMFERSGRPLGLDVERLIATSHWFESQLGRALPAALSRAGAFPHAAAQETARTSPVTAAG